ncbi:hypothetical protein LEP1GSC062_0161 [Leptospira alexanderi serovar Manhao 3 str. L 60]|uniref:Uncharacterized protein n=1 Tax=Leptospira alexanderi serovar Manhao 3 str. L 60 TaxID=1049759 RepID=V6I5E4_9LEPT|nr:hypothetical protein LEP1GSC062_0161 [Leptospira alexanderi serovar Manhao 3 str. L 60]
MAGQLHLEFYFTFKTYVFQCYISIIFPPSIPLSLIESPIFP